MNKVVPIHKPLPEEIPMKASMFGDGKNGYAMQTYGNDEFKVFVTAIKEKHGEPFVEHWSSERTGEDLFDDFKALREAYNAALVDGRE